MINVALQMGAAIGVAVLATVSTTRTAHLLTTGAGAHEALTAGYRLAFAVATGCVVVALALTTLLRSSEGEAVSGRRTGAPAGPAVPSRADSARTEHQPLRVEEEPS